MLSCETAKVETLVTCDPQHPQEIQRIRARLTPELHLSGICVLLPRLDLQEKHERERGARFPGFGVFDGGGRDRWDVHDSWEKEVDLAPPVATAIDAVAVP